jgi:hypothetical protein
MSREAALNSSTTSTMDAAAVSDSSNVGDQDIIDSIEDKLLKGLNQATKISILIYDLESKLKDDVARVKNTLASDDANETGPRQELLKSMEDTLGQLFKITPSVDECKASFNGTRMEMSRLVEVHGGLRDTLSNRVREFAKIKKDNGELKLDNKSLKTEMVKVKSDLAVCQDIKERIALRQILNRLPTVLYLYTFDKDDDDKSYSFLDLDAELLKLGKTEEYNMRDGRIWQIVKGTGFNRDVWAEKINDMKIALDLNRSAHPKISADDEKSCIEYMKGQLDSDGSDLIYRVIKMTRHVLSLMD